MATNAREARAESASLFKLAWEAQATVPKIVYEDEPRGESVAALDEWVGFTWSEGFGDIASLGNKHFRIGGIVVIEIYSASNRGTRRMDELKDLALGTFQTAPSGEVTYRRPTPLNVDDEGKWHRKNVTVEFEYEQIRP